MTAPSEPALVSIIIPCYQQAECLKEAIDSALAQTYPAVEIIVVNDGSDDGTEAVAMRYGDRIQYIYQPNRGVSAARNTGIARARGTYFKFLDGDDHLHPEQIAWQVQSLAGRTDRISVTGVRLYRDGAPEEYVDHTPTARALLPDLFQDTFWGGINGFLVPAGLVRAAHGFNESLSFHEDLDFFARVGLLGPELIPDARVGAYYRLRARSLSTRRQDMTTVRARLLIGLHETLKKAQRPDWFGIDLLRMEQDTYQGLVTLGIGEPNLLDSLLRRIKELQQRAGFGQFGWRFRLLTRLVGYAWAERIRTRVVKLLKVRPPESLDTGSWREDTAKEQKPCQAN